MTNSPKKEKKTYTVYFNDKTLLRLFKENLYRYELIQSVKDNDQLKNNSVAQDIISSSEKLSYSATYIYSRLKQINTNCVPSTLRYDSFTSLKDEIQLRNLLTQELYKLIQDYYMYFSTVSCFKIPFSELHNLKQYLSEISSSLIRIKRSKAFKELIKFYVIKYEFNWIISQGEINLLLHLHFIFAVPKEINIDIVQTITDLLNKFFNYSLSTDISKIRSIKKVVSYILKSLEQNIFHEPTNRKGKTLFHVSPYYKILVLSSLKKFHPLTISRKLQVTRKRSRLKNEYLNNSDINKS